MLFVLMFKVPGCYVPHIFLCLSFLVYLLWVLLIIFLIILQAGTSGGGSLAMHIDKFYEVRC